ncbi:NAD(P)-dependent oxidoreductase [Flavobacterium sp.]|uniref:NAD-dependent epimerase/dehydratase family protein n=1 Tax=Flavobacterium sp. TaxID=239 RepID=UPI0026009041|nr:NAD(P)-dependent oxidoreductase [Flavobacterium sp.]
MSNNKNIAIVGANSILGQAIYERLIKDYAVFQVYHLNIDAIKNKINLIQIDDFLKTDIDFKIIYYISAAISFKEDITTINSLFHTNIKLLKTVSNTFTNSKIIYASSVAVFEINAAIVTEISPVLPYSSYAFSKLWAEQIVANHVGGGVTIRLSSLYGIGMKNNSFLPKIIYDAISNKQITIFGDGSRKQNYISADEASEYFYKAIHYPDKIKLLAVNSQSYSNLEVAQMIVKSIQDVKIIFLAQDTSTSFNYNNNFTKNILKINQDYSFNESIQEVIQWIQKLY